MTVFVKITVCTADFERAWMCESQFFIWTCLNFYITSVSKMLTLSLLWSVVFLLCLLLFSSFFLRFPFNSVTSVFSFIFYDFVVAYSFFIVLVILLFASFEWGSFVFFEGFQYSCVSVWARILLLFHTFLCMFVHDDDGLVWVCRWVVIMWTLRANKASTMSTRIYMCVFRFVCIKMFTVVVWKYMCV